MHFGQSGPFCPGGLTAQRKLNLHHRRRKPMSVDTDRIRTLNDELRKHLLGGGAVITPGVAALGAAVVERLVTVIATFDDFCAANDPYDEHDFGQFQFDGTPVIFKIDYYDKDLAYQSPDPANPLVTERIITIMLAEEY
jgi:Protein of unknown function (DUF3768)